MPRPAALACCTAALVGLSLFGCDERAKYTPTECTVWTERDGAVTGTVYMRDKQASFAAGGMRSSAAYLNAANDIMVMDGAQAIPAARFDGQTLFITYLTDAKFESQGFDNGTLVIASDTYRTEFYYNSLCTAGDVAVGATTLFTRIFPIGGSGGV